MRFLVVPSLLAAVIVAAACGGKETETVTLERTVAETTGVTGPDEEPTLLKIYLLDEGKVAPASRSVVPEPDIVRAALAALLTGPEDEDLATAIPAQTEVEEASASGGVVDVTLSRSLSPLGRAQVVYTLTALPNVRRVSFGEGKAVGRRAFEAQTPAILVESPLPGESVESGFEVTGTANTFEATFNYELKDARDRVLRKNFVTATSGSGTRGTFRFTVRYAVDEPQDGRLLVFELSAEDGSRINESEIPLRLE
jgi:germination protein M